MSGQPGRPAAINAEATNFYREQLLCTPTAQGPCRYLKERRLAHALEEDSVWQIGYAPAHWRSLSDHLSALGFTEAELTAAGVASSCRRGGTVDRFRDRIMLPQRDEQGDVVGFIGRAAPSAPADVPKYLNSPATDIFNKRELLFGLYESMPALSTGARPILVEGPLDVLAIDAASRQGDSRLVALAPCGTALTDDHVDLIGRHTSDGVGALVAYDNDDAGRRAESATYKLLANCRPLADGHLTAASLPRGTDPSELLRVHGGRALHTALTDTSLHTSLAQRAIDAELQTWAHVLDGAEGRIAAVKAVAPLIATLPAAEVAGQVTRLARQVDLDPTNRHHGTHRSLIRGRTRRPPPSQTAYRFIEATASTSGQHLANLAL